MAFARDRCVLILSVCLSTAPLHAQRDTLGTLSNLLTSSAASVLVTSRDGSTGAGSVISIRGSGEPTVSSQPLLIIDGVRVDNGVGHDNAIAPDRPAPARFDDLDPSEIERIEILPGAAAATLYGPGAADGVILVTTRRGGDRPISGRLTVEGGLTTTPSFEQPSYYAWGHTTTGSPVQCFTYDHATGSCVVDSVTHFNPLLSDATSPFTTANERRFSAELGAHVAGARAFLAAHYGDEIGTLVMPDPDIALYEADHRVAPPVTERRPSAADRADIRGQLASEIGRVADVTIGGGLIGVHQRATNVDQMLNDAAFGPARRDSNDGWPSSVLRPSQLFTDVPTERATHAMGNVTGHWRPLSILDVHATAGSDATDQTSVISQTATFGGETSVFQAHDRQVGAQYTTDLGATLSLRGSTTTIGGQYLERHFREQTDSSSCLSGGPVFSGQVCGSSSRTIFPAADRTQSLYASEAVSIASHLTLGAGVRWNHERLHIARLQYTSIDPTLHGQLVVLGTTAAPLVSLHGAFGQTNSVPSPREAINDMSAYVLTTCFVGNIGETCAEGSRIRPERQREAEGGVSASLPNGRLTFDATVYERRSVHVIFPELLPQTAGGGTLNFPTGIVRDGGLDVSLGGRIIESRVVDWNASFNAFVNENKVLRTPVPFDPWGGTTMLAASVDHPVFGIFTSPYSYADANHDGVIEPSEVTTAPSLSYVGPAIPTRGAALSTAVELFGHRLRIGSLFDYRGGYVLPDMAGYWQALFQSSAAVNAPGASLADQARAIAARNGDFGTGYVQRVNALRWRELSLTAPLPIAPSVQLTVAARNLALSTNYRGPDPDADMTTSNGLALRLPQTRTWLLRLSAGF